MDRRLWSGLLLVLMTGQSCAWLEVCRRWLALSVLVPGLSMAEMSYAEGSSKVPGRPPVLQSQILYPEFIRMEGPTGDFSINIPTGWRVEFDNSPGRLITACESNAGFNSATLQVARISLANLLRSEGLEPPGDDQTSNWKDVTSSKVSEKDLAQTLMRLAQRGLSDGKVDEFAKISEVETEIEASEGNVDATSFLWRAKAAVQDFRQQRIISGRALLRRGIIVFAVVNGSERFGAVSSTVSARGTGWEFNNRLVGSLRLRRPAG